MTAYKILSYICEVHFPQMTLTCLKSCGFQSYFIQIFKNSGMDIEFFQMSFWHCWSSRYVSLQSINLATSILKHRAILTFPRQSHGIMVAWDERDELCVFAFYLFFF